MLAIKSNKVNLLLLYIDIKIKFNNSIIDIIPSAIPPYI